MKLYIRNMACESCKVLVKDSLEMLRLHPIKVELGEAEVKERLSEQQKKDFSRMIGKGGLELVKNKEAVLIDQIKHAILEYISSAENSKKKLSGYLSKKLHYDYAYLSGYFSTMQASTIEQYTIALKIEKVKEMLVLEDLTLSQIADKLNYSSVAHLSSQFKKVTGLPASHFKKLRSIRRHTIQQL